MAANLTGEGIRVFRCPNCREFINTTLQQCRFCGVELDPVAADASATAQSKLNAVCSDASYARILAGIMWVMFFVSFIPLFGLFLFGTYLLFFAVPFMVVRSWRRLSALGKSEDPAFRGARSYLRMAALMWSPMLILMGLNVLGDFVRR
jgi:hypothetical protein